MEKPASFDLNRALQDWRAQLADSSSVKRESLDELETHLRESVARLCGVGLSEEEAWLIAQKRFGQANALGAEFAKIQSPARRRGLSEKQFIAALLGGFALVTAVLVYFDPPSDFMNWMDKISEPQWLRDHLFERYGLALPSVHDLKTACIAVVAFLAGVALYMVVRDKHKNLRPRCKTQPHST
jgi:hypothetical protein